MEYKNYQIKNDGTYAMYIISPIGRGSVPKELRGLYTSKEIAMKAIDSSEADKESKNGKKVSVG